MLVRHDRVAAVGRDLARADPVAVGRAEVLDVAGLVVGPGFVDLHSHVHSVLGQRLQAMDGVTTSLDLEAGLSPTDAAYAAAAAEGRPLHYGFAAAWATRRCTAVSGQEVPPTITASLALLADPRLQEDTDPAARARLLALLGDDLAAGALGIGVLVGYAPRSDPAEYLAVALLAAGAGVPTYTHVRELVEADPRTPVDGVDELVRAAAATGAHMHHCHVNSTSRRHVDRVLATLDRARAEGSRVTVEAYPYGAGATGIGAAFLAPERLGAWDLTPRSITYLPTGETVADAARLRELRTLDPGGLCVVRFLDDDDLGDVALLRRSLTFADSIVASDAMPVALPAGTDPLVWPPPAGSVTHPRTAGTFARALRMMVREIGTWTWVEAFRRCSLLPARVVAEVAPGARGKGWLAPGADADLVVLDPAALSDTASYAEGARPSVGVRHLLVAGTLLVRDGRLDPTVLPGRPLRGSPA